MQQSNVRFLPGIATFAFDTSEGLVIGYGKAGNGNCKWKMEIEIRNEKSKSKSVITTHKHYPAALSKFHIFFLRDNIHTFIKHTPIAPK